MTCLARGESGDVPGGSEPGADEDAALVEPVDLDDYAHAKVAAERATTAAVGNRLLITRPGPIAGPGDTSDRFGYWVSRLALAADEPVLVPDAAARSVQFIDIRDLAGWMISASHRQLTGIYNAVGSEHDFSRGHRQGPSYDRAFVSVSD